MIFYFFGTQNLTQKSIAALLVLIFLIRTEWLLVRVGVSFSVTLQNLRCGSNTLTPNNRHSGMLRDNELHVRLVSTKVRNSREIQPIKYITVIAAYVIKTAACPLKC